jgi:hypothetical protein
VLWAKWQGPNELIGVRFNAQTRYGLLDIDAESAYCNAESLAEIRAALETIGIVRTLLIRSSHSGGLHLYIPLPEPIKTFDLAVALYECLTAQGFQFQSGQLEQFPNVKTYGNERIVHYNGHRLPLQPDSGSCLLDDDLNPIGDRLDHFLWLWDHAASQQAMDELRHALKIGRDNHRKWGKKQRRSSPRSEAWRQDLETDITDGWSGPGQTNPLLKTIACHGHVFLHLEGDELICHTLETAQQLPGYQQHCRHQHHIEIRVRAWCKAVQNYYWPQGTEPKRDTTTELPPTPSVNYQRAQDAKARIQQAFNHLQSSHQLPERISDRARALMAQARTSKETLYKPENLPLWHPEHRLEPQPAPPKSVQPEPASLSAPQPSSSPTPAQSPKPIDNGKVRTSERFMKCRQHPAQSAAKGQTGGVRGDLLSFQPVENVSASSGSAHVQQSVQRSTPPPSSSPVLSPDTAPIAAASSQSAFLQAIGQQLGHDLKPPHVRSLKKLWPERVQETSQLIMQISDSVQRGEVVDVDRYLTAALKRLLDGTWDLPTVPSKLHKAAHAELSADVQQWLQHWPLPGA